LGKTETIKERAVWVYAQTLEQRSQWENIAKENNMPLSKWIVQTIEDSLFELEDEVKSRKDIEKENKNLKKEISELQDKMRQLTIIRDNLEKEIRKYRAEPFLNPPSEGVIHYEKEIVNILRNAKGVDGKTRYLGNDEILARLGVKLSETESVKSIATQLSLLEGYGLIKSTSKGWKWKE